MCLGLYDGYSTSSPTHVLDLCVWYIILYINVSGPLWRVQYFQPNTRTRYICVWSCFLPPPPSHHLHRQKTKNERWGRGNGSGARGRGGGGGRHCKHLEDVPRQCKEQHPETRTIQHRRPSEQMQSRRNLKGPFPHHGDGRPRSMEHSATMKAAPCWSLGTIRLTLDGPFR